MAGLVSAGFSGLRASAGWPSGFLAAAGLAVSATAAGLAAPALAGATKVAAEVPAELPAELKVRPLALGEVGCGPLALRRPAEGPEKCRPLLSGSFAGAAAMGRMVPKTMVAGSGARPRRSEEHTSELQSLMRISYAGFCL